MYTNTFKGQKRMRHLTQLQTVIQFLFHIIDWRIPFFALHAIFKIDGRKSQHFIAKYWRPRWKWLSRRLFAVRPCSRQLKYIGPADSFFVKNHLYRSINFTGATYAFENYLDEKGELKRIGRDYFTVINE